MRELMISYIAVIGLMLGSFFNVYVYRTLNNLQWYKGKSRCDNCKHELGVLDLIPLISFIYLRGKCRYCGNKIGYNHIISEVLFLIGFTTLAIFEPLDLTSCIAYVVLITIGINVISDIIERVTLTNTIYLGGFIVVILKIITNLTLVGWLPCLVYVVLVAFCCVILHFISNLMQKVMGGGDFDILLLFFAYGGIQCMLDSLFLGSFIGTLVLLPLLVTGKVNRKTELPFVPILYIGFLIHIIIR